MIFEHTSLPRLPRPQRSLLRQRSGLAQQRGWQTPVLVGVILALSGSLLCGSAQAQALALPPSQAVPPGHGSSGFQKAGPAPDSVEPDVNLPGRQVNFGLLDAEGEPLAGILVELVQSYESIAEGGRTTVFKAITDLQGNASFSNLEPAMRYSYSPRVKYQGGSYSLEAFRISEKFGYRVRMHVYPATADEKTAFVGMRGFVYIALREDQFQFDVLYRVVTMSKLAWLPKGLRMTMPLGYKAFEGTPSAPDTGFFEKDGKIELRGTYPPGQRDARFGFQVSRKQDSEQSFELDVPPHVAELRVIVESVPGLRLEVPGFEAAETAKGPDGKKVLITRRLLTPGQNELRHLKIQLLGLPVAGKERWVAAFLALGIAALGALLVFIRRHQPHPEIEQQRNQARLVLLEELIALEQTHEAGAIGPETFAEARRTLLLAVARLEPDEPGMAPAVPLLKSAKAV